MTKSIMTIQKKSILKAFDGVEWYKFTASDYKRSEFMDRLDICISLGMSVLPTSGLLCGYNGAIPNDESIDDKVLLKLSVPEEEILYFRPSGESGIVLDDSRRYSDISGDNPISFNIMGKYINPDESNIEVLLPYIKKEWIEDYSVDRYVIKAFYTQHARLKYIGLNNADGSKCNDMNFYKEVADRIRK